MKALVYTASRRLEIQELPIPAIKDDEVLVRIRAVGVCGSDVHGFLGKSKKRVPPLVLGHEFAGQVAATGSSVVAFKAGDSVAVYPLIACGHCRYCKAGRENICPERKVYGLDFHGGLAEYVAAPQHLLFPLPAGMSFLEGSLVEPLANTVHVMERCQGVADQVGLILGAGPIGLFCFWTARQFGASKLAIVDLNSYRLSVAESLGADLTIHGKKQDVLSTILDWTNGQGVDFCIDAVGNPICRQNSIACTATGGTVVWIGTEEDYSPVDARSVITREIQIRGTYSYSKTNFAHAMSMLAQKQLPYQSLTFEAGLDDGQKVFEELSSGSSSIMKAIFVL